MSTWVEREFERREREKEEWLKSRPVCDRCGDPIQDEGMYKIDGYVFCEECWEEYAKENFWEEIE